MLTPVKQGAVCLVPRKGSPQVFNYPRLVRSPLQHRTVTEEARPPSSSASLPPLCKIQAVKAAAHGTQDREAPPGQRLMPIDADLQPGPPSPFNRPPGPCLPGRAPPAPREVARTHTKRGQMWKAGENTQDTRKLVSP